MAKTRQSTRLGAAATSVIVTVNTASRAIKDRAEVVSDSGPIKKKARVKDESDEDLDPLYLIKESASEQEPSKPVKRLRSIKNNDIDPPKFLPRQSVENPWKIGAHVSASGGVENAVVNAAAIGASAFGLFLKSQRKWSSPPLSDSSIAKFKERMLEFGYTSRMVLPHGSYLVNLGNPDNEKRQRSYICFLEDLKRCEALGLELYNFHPGSTVGQTTVETSLRLISECINRAHKLTRSVTVVLENMAGTGNVIGSEFSHLSGIIAGVEDKKRIGVCLDTCHLFAAGCDIRTKEGWNSIMSNFDSEIGLRYLCGMHLNDSKGVCGSRKDRHENIGLGHLSLVTFQHILTDPRTQNIPLILETPSFEKPMEVWGVEIDVLRRVSGTRVNQHGMGEEDLDALVNEVKVSVQGAGKGAGKAKAKAKSNIKEVNRLLTASGTRKRKRKGIDDHSDDDLDDEKGMEEGGSEHEYKEEDELKYGAEDEGEQ